MRIKTKLLGSFGLVLLLCGATGFLGVQKLAEGNVRMTDFVGGPFATAGTLANLRADAAAAQQAVSDIVVSNDPNVMTAARQTFDQRYEAAQASIQRYAAKATEAEKVAATALAQNMDRFHDLAVTSMDLAQRNERKRASDAILNVSGPMFDLLDMSAASLRDEIVLLDGPEAAVTLGGQLRSDIMNFRRMFTLSLAVTEDARLKQIQANAEWIGGVVDRKLAQIEKTLRVANIAAPALPRVQKRWDEVKPAGLANLALGVSNSTFKAGEIHRSEITPLFQKIEAQIAEIVSGETARASALVDGNAAAYTATRLLLIALAAGAVLLGLVAALWMASSIARGLKLAIHHAENIGRGDISQPIPHHARDEMGLLMTAMSTMRSKLNAIVSEVRASAEQVSSGALQSAATAGQLSSGATEQAAASEQASAAIEEMAANVRQNSDNAQTTEKIATKASANALASGEAVIHSVDAMRLISEKIHIVREIARQTDLLALNAAIEAARAGSHGKGFAVVASEVRKLAERSQGAAIEISNLAVSTLATSEDAGLKLRELLPDIQRTAELVSEISAACREQSVGIEQINQAIQQLDQVTQSNAGAANEMNATADALAGEANLLNERTGFFQLDRTGNGSQDAAQTREVTPPNVVRMSPPLSPVRAHASQPQRETAGIDLSLDDETEFERLSA